MWLIDTREDEKSQCSLDVLTQNEQDVGRSNSSSYFLQRLLATPSTSNRSESALCRRDAMHSTSFLHRPTTSVFSSTNRRLVRKSIGVAESIGERAEISHHCQGE